MKSNRSAFTPLAIVGASCRLPGANGLDEFWNLVRSGGDATGELPSDLLNRDLLYHPEKGKRGKTYSCVGGLVPRLPFDNRKCGLPADEIENYDVAHLTMCEVASDALSHAGYDPTALPTKNVGVFVGHTGGSSKTSDLMYGIGIRQTSKYLNEISGFEKLPENERNAVIDQLVNDARNRYDFRRKNPELSFASVNGAQLIARAFELDGPCLVVDAACASSLQALAIAARALDQGSIDMAVVGGASCCKSDSLVLFSAAQSVSEGRSRPFDAEASGLVTAEGYIALIIKRLPDAIEAGDNVLGVIRGIGMSADGKGKSLWAPLKDGQILAVERAYREPLAPSDIQYMEAHATSTQVGDATELSALAEVFPSELPGGRRIALGSVKANIGHTLETAGLAGLVKVLLAMKHGEIPPCANVDQPNPAIAWEELPFYLPRTAERWPETPDGEPKLAAVNAFGIGGLNVHVVLQEYVAAPHGQAAGLHAGRTRGTQANKSASALPNPEPIAVVGIGSILPGAETTDEFFELIKSGTDPKRPVRPERLKVGNVTGADARPPASLGDMIGGYCDDYIYDWRKHRVPPKQIAAANPLQFMLLDAADQALADAGYRDREFDHDRVGVVVGTIFEGDFTNQLQMGLRLPEFGRDLRIELRKRGMDAGTIESICKDFEELLIERMPALVDETGSFTSSTLASRITKTFNLRGGALALDAGDGTGLAALSAAVDVLRTRECDMMVCAVGQRSMDIASYEAMQQKGWLATGAPSLAFDRQSNGCVPGEGCGVVLLKRLSDAEAQGDKILATIRSVQGSSNWTTPGASLSKAAKRALQAAQRSPSDIGLVEATGAVPGVESWEIAQIESALPSTNRKHPLVVSSIVPQFGYLGAAHSIAGTIKSCLSLSRGEYPAGMATQEAREGLFHTSRPLSAEQASQLQRNQVSAIGIACGAERGTSYCAIIETVEAAKRAGTMPAISTVTSEELLPLTLRVGAHDWPSLKAKLESLAIGPDAFERPFGADEPTRVAMVAASVDGIVELCRNVCAEFESLSPPNRETWAKRGVFFGSATGSRGCAFLFPGQGSQYAGMLEAIRRNPAVQPAVRQIETALDALGYGTLDEFIGPNATGLGTDIWKTQISVLLSDWLIDRSLKEFGVSPSIVTGHSFGEYAALASAGAWSLTDAIRAARHRSDSLELTTHLDGCMAATAVPAEALRPMLEGLGEPVYIANKNGPQQTVVAGRRPAVTRLVETLKAHKKSAVLINVPCPFHSPLLKPSAERFAELIGDVTLSDPRIPIVSTAGLGVIRNRADASQSLIQQIVEPVDFPRMVQEVVKTKPAIFVEAGPKQVLTRLAKQIIQDSDIILMSVDNPQRRGFELQDVAAQAECLGVDGKPQESGSPDSLRSARGSQSQLPAQREPRIVTFDATERRRDKMRSNSQRVPTHPAPASQAPGVSNVAASATGTRAEQAASSAPAPAPAPATPTSANTNASVAIAPSANDTLALQAAPASQSVSTSSMPQAQVDLDELRSILVEFVVEQTGYPEDIIEMDADLEGDLGIDSIKKAQLFGEVGSRFEIAPREDLSLDDFPTLNDVLSFLVDELQGRDTGVADATLSAPVDAADPVTASSVSTAPMPTAVENVSTSIGGVGAATEVHAASSDPVASTTMKLSPSTETAISYGVAERTAGPNDQELQRILIDFVIEQTGYPEDIIEMDADLEGDLGIDSIKKAQLFGEVGATFDIAPRDDLSLDDFPTLTHVLNFLREELGGRETQDVQAYSAATLEAEPAVAPQTIAEDVDSPDWVALSTLSPDLATSHVPASTASVHEAEAIASDDAIDSAELTRILLDFVIEQTGYPEDIIEMDADLEADLGIDSIKKAQLFGEVGSRFDIAPREDLSLDDFPTLNHVLNFLIQELAADTSPVTVAAVEVEVEPIAAIGHLPELDNAVSGSVSQQNDERDAIFAQNTECLPVVTLGGTPESMGMDVGQQLRDSIVRALNAMVDRSNGQSAAATVGWNAPLTHEMDSIAKAIGTHPDSIKAWNAWWISSPQRIRFVPQDDQLLECNESSAQWHLQVRRPSTGLPYLVIAPIGQLAVPYAVNGEGVAISCAPCEQRSVEAGEISSLLHATISNGRRADDVVATLKTAKPRHAFCVGVSEGGAASYFVVDSTGCRQVAEANASRTQIEFHEELAANAGSLCLYDPVIQFTRRVDLAAVLEGGTPSTSTAAQSSTAPSSTAIPAGRPNASVSISPLPSAFKMHRHVMRMTESREALTTRPDFGNRCVLIVGGGSLSETLQQRFVNQGFAPRLASLDEAIELVANDDSSTRPQHLVMLLEEAITTQPLAALTPAAQFANWFKLCQRWVGKSDEANQLESSTMIAVTRMGGDFGFSGGAERVAAGGISGLLKAIRREHPTLTTKAIDVSSNESTASVATAVYQELTCSSKEAEVGYRDGKRLVVKANAEPIGDPNDAATRFPSRGGVWVVTGGGRGVTAVVARELGSRLGLKLHLLGTAPLPKKDAEWRGKSPAELKELRKQTVIKARQEGRSPVDVWRAVEKAMELERNLAELQDRGVDATYHVCDVSDRNGLAATLDAIRNQHGPIEGVIHGAGIEAACRFSRKKEELVYATIASKCDAFSNLVGLLANDPLKYFVSFGSTSGRFGGLGQADYSLASDWLAKMTGQFASSRPECRSICFHWPAWDEVGMAARPESRMALEQGGLSFMPPLEGVAHVVNELVSNRSDHEILILDSPGMLDTDGTMQRSSESIEPSRFRYHPTSNPPQAGTTRSVPAVSNNGAHSNGFQSKGAQVVSPPANSSSTGVLLAAPTWLSDRRTAVADVSLDPNVDPFLIHHVFRGRPFCPGVVSLELFAQAARHLRPNEEFIGFNDVQLQNGLSLVKDKLFSAQVRMTEEPDGIACSLVGPFDSPNGRRLESNRVYAKAKAVFGPTPQLPQADPGKPVFGWTPFMYPAESVIVHGPPLQTFKQLDFRHGNGRAKVDGGAHAELMGPRSENVQMTSPATLDGCLVACGFFAFAMIKESVGLPSSIKALRQVRPTRTHEKCVVRFYYKETNDLGHVFDFTLFGEDKQPILQVDGYQMACVQETGA